MAANAANIMDNGDAFSTILGTQARGTQGFGLSARAVTVFRADYDTARNLMDSDVEQIKEVIKNINSTYRDHDINNRRCYINATMAKRIITFYHWTVFAVKEGGAVYDVDTVADFDLNWVNTIMDSYTMVKPEVTAQSTAFSVEVCKYDGTNWFDVKGQILQLMSTRIGHAGIPLSYILRDSRKEWSDTEDMTSIQDRRIATKVLQGSLYDLDNKELFRILGNVLGGTTLEEDVNKFKRTKSGYDAWNAVTEIVEGANYSNDLKRRGDAMVKNLFYDPTKKFSFERYYQLHARSHEIFAAADEPVAEWRKINQFMQGVRCSQLQDDFRTMKSDPRYNTFTTFYNKISENYRMLIDQEIIRPASVFKRKISQVSNGGGRGRGSGRGRGGRGRHGGRGRGGRGRGGRSGGRFQGRGGRGRGHDQDDSQIDLSSLPSNIDLSNLSFPDDQWYGFSQPQRNAINSLRNFRNQQRYVNSMTNRDRDEISTLGAQSQTPVRHVYELNVVNPPALPPHPNESVTPTPPNGNRGGSISSQHAGNAFGRRSGSS